ncbi:hypothetical protein [Brevundimonas sp.]|uniref:hypothetical protein n=1 Tax=Brevundimonas sp. TaxID=1871086 RepID=UPI003F6EFE58
MKRVLIPSILLMLAACAGGDAAVPAPPQPSELTLLEAGRETVVLAPNGSMRLVSKGDGEVLISAGLFNRDPVARIELTSRASWAPDSKHLFINDSGSAAWSRFRLFEVGPNGAAREHAEIHRAAIAELGRLNGCASVPDPDATTWGMAWAADGKQIYVLAQARRETGACRWGAVETVVVVADVKTGRLLETVPGAEARRRFPTLPWDGAL